MKYLKKSLGMCLKKKWKKKWMKCPQRNVWNCPMKSFKQRKSFKKSLEMCLKKMMKIFGSAEFEAEGDEECSEEMCEMNAAKIDTSLEDGSCIESDEKSMHLHFVDCIVLDDEKSDAFIAISCIEARLSAIRHHYPHLKHVIFQSDNVKNFAGKVTKMYLHQAPIAGGMTIVAYYHNEAAAGKDVCGSHFAHQQLRVEAYMYIAKGEWERKVSTPKQLAVALSTKCVKNTTVLLVKPKHDCLFMAVKLPPKAFQPIWLLIMTTILKPLEFRFFTTLDSLVLLAERGTNVKVPTVQCSGVSMAIHYADEVLSTRDFTVDGQARAMITSITNPGTSTYASFEVSFIAGWAHCQKNQYPELSTRVQDFIAQCWRTGEESNVEASAVKSHLKVSAEAVQAQLASQYTDGLLLFSEVLWSVKFEQCTKKLIEQHKHPEHE
ncbi:hypothetical protein EMCRGX_G018473 [Ephydatia muelleri]